MVKIRRRFKYPYKVRFGRHHEVFTTKKAATQFAKNARSYGYKKARVIKRKRR